jgi:hypothetical protein
MLYCAFPLCKSKDIDWEINMLLEQVLFILLHFLKSLAFVIRKTLPSNIAEGINNQLCLLILQNHKVFFSGKDKGKVVPMFK